MTPGLLPHTWMPSQRMQGQPLAGPLMSLRCVMGVVLLLAMLPGVASAQEGASPGRVVPAVAPAASDAPRANLEVAQAPVAPKGLIGGLSTPGSPMGMQPRPPFQVLPLVVSVVPGLLFHGLGPLTAGDTRMAG